MAATVALIAIVGTIPYIALQLKAVSSSLETILAHVTAGTEVTRPLLGDIALFVALSMATFAVLFGTRHIDATEHQDGLMLAVATELIVKLLAFLAVGIFVTFWMFDGPIALFKEAMQRPSTAAIFGREPRADTLIAMTLLSFVAFILLPRQFHVAVVENNREGEIKRAVWLYPLYLVLINLFVVPIALAGLLTFPAGKVDSDMFVLALPLESGSIFFTIIAFVGGLSAATAMVIVELVALSIMVSNDLIMPFVLQRRERLINRRDNIGSMLLTVRRLAIFAILLLAYMYYRLAGEAQLASIGLLSFAAIAQLAPAFFGGTPLATRDLGRSHCRNVRRFPRVGIYTSASNAVRHRRGWGTNSHCRTLGSEHASSAAPAGAGTASFSAWGDVEPATEHAVLYRLLAPPGAFANRAAASEYFRAFGFHTDRSKFPPVALFGNGGRTHNHDRALSRRRTHAIGV